MIEKYHADTKVKGCEGSLKPINLKQGVMTTLTSINVPTWN